MTVCGKLGHSIWSCYWRALSKPAGFLVNHQLVTKVLVTAVTDQGYYYLGNTMCQKVSGKINTHRRHVFDSVLSTNSLGGVCKYDAFDVFSCLKIGKLARAREMSGSRMGMPGR